MRPLPAGQRALAGLLDMAHRLQLLGEQEGVRGRQGWRGGEEGGERWGRTLLMVSGRRLLQHIFRCHMVIGKGISCLVINRS